MLQRMIGAAMLKASVFEEIEADRSALPQAIVIVVLVTIFGIIGSVLSGIIGGEEQSATGIAWAVSNGVLFGLLRWVLWVTVILFVGGVMLKVSETQTDWAEMGRIVGFAYTPGLLILLSFIPVVGGLIGLVAFIWTVVAVIVGIKHALDFEGTGRAVLVAVISAVIAAIPLLILAIIQWIVT